MSGLLVGCAGLGTSSVTVAVPALSDPLGVPAHQAVWVISLFALTLSIGTPVFGRLSDSRGIRTPFLVGIAVMSLGAVAASVAPSFGLLLAGRLLQGAGAAALPTLSAGLVTALFRGSDRSRALALMAGSAVVVAGIGPFIGASVLQVLGWRAVLAMPVLSLLALPLLLRRAPASGSRARLDLPGAALTAITAAGLVLLVQSPSSGALVALLGVILLAVGLPLAARHLRRHPHGFLTVGVVREPVVLRAAAGAGAVCATWFAMLIAVPAALVAAGWSAVGAGLVIAPCALAGVATARLAGTLLARLGGTRVLVIAALFGVVAMVVGAAGLAAVSWPLLVLVAVAAAVAFGLAQPSLVETISGAVDIDERGAAVGFGTFLFLFGGAIGAAVIGGLSGFVGVPFSLLVVAALAVLGSGVLLIRRSEGRGGA